jgi:putative sterol carrier protein
MPIAFSTEWAAAWGDALNASTVYREAAATWEGSIVVLATGPSTAPRAAFLDVWHGACRAARAATTEDVASAAFVLEADPAAWRDLLTGKVAPMMGLLTGRIRLARGQLAKLLPYATAAKELVSLAATVDTVFPEDW